jgi:hypothetical protein
VGGGEASGRLEGNVYARVGCAPAVCVWRGLDARANAWPSKRGSGALSDLHGPHQDLIEQLVVLIALRRPDVDQLRTRQQQHHHHQEE